MDSNFDKLKDVIGKIKIAMLTTIDNGELRSRPMATAEISDDGALWFFTYGDSAKTHEIDMDRHVAISYVDKDKDIYISVSGVASVVEDKYKVDKLWNPAYNLWFEKGRDDSDIMLLRVEPHFAELWEAPSGIKTEYEIAPVLDPAQYEKGENRKFRF